MKKIFIVVVLLMVLKENKAQDINFSQFYELPLLRNPALAGMFTGDIRFTADYRNQWASVSTPYKTQALSTDLKYAVSKNSNDYLALGMQITNDVAGDSKLGKIQLLPTLAFHKSLDADKDTYLSLGFLGGIVQQRFDASKLRFDDQFVNGAYSPLNPTKQTFDNSKVTYYDGSVGLLFSSVAGYDIKYYFGASYSHFTQPKVAFSNFSDIRLNKKLMFNAGISLPTSEYDKVIFYLDVFTQGGNRQGQGGVMLKHDIIQEDDDVAFSISGGAFLRGTDAIIPMIKMDYYRWAVGLTYDVNISKLRPASQARGAYELTLSYRNFLNIRSSSIDKIRCPVGLDN